jgi:small conductance mechanosensitive channel
MTDAIRELVAFRSLTWQHVLIVLAVLVGARALVEVIRRVVRRAAESAPSHRRLLFLRLAPIAKVLIGIAAIAIIIPVLVEPTFDDVVALIATVAIALAFALKDYVSSLAAGIVAILENTYQPGDWIEFDGTYGEVKTIGMRAVHIVTADDDDVIVPHSKIWTSRVSNASGGSHNLTCVANFYLHADHDGEAVRQALAEVAEKSSYRKPGSRVMVGVAEMPWGTRYKVKLTANDSRDQFALVSDLTVRGKERLRTMTVTFAQAPYVQNHAS